jgi:DNA invertase Pin-like site-specific DNA recombinase
VLVWLGARGARAAVLAVIAGALVFGAPGSAAAHDGAAQGAGVARVGWLAEGVGMGDQPSVRVRVVQRVLDRRGYGLGAPGVDGRFGPLTAAAVRRYQARNGLTVDGIVGPRTRGALADLQARQQATERRRHDARTPQRAGAPPGERRDSSSRGSRTPPRDAPAPPPRRPAAAPGRDSAAIAIALFAAAVSLIAITAAFGPHRTRRTRGRRTGADTDANAVAITRDVLLEGHSDDPRIGAFRGYALASAVPHHDDDPDNTRFLVDDPRKPTPIWVSTTDITRTTSDLPAHTPVIGYVTVPPGPSDHDEHAFTAIETHCTTHHWHLLEIVRDPEHTRMPQRPGLTYALQQITAGRANALIVSDLQRLTRSLTDLAALLQWFREAHATLIALDLDLDTTTTHGDHLATTLITLSDWERQRIAQRTRSGLARVKAQGNTTGRPAVADNPQLLARIAAMRQHGMTLQAISDQLNNEHIPTLRGGTKWRPSSVQAALGYKRPKTRNPKDQLPPTQPQQHKQQHH